MIIWLIYFKNKLVKSNFKFLLFWCDLNCPVPVYTYYKTEIDDNLSEVDEDFFGQA